MEDEEDFLSLITLTKKDVIIEQVQRLELWDDIDQEVLGLVSEETDALNDLTMG
jgi:hypothetical protein